MKAALVALLLAAACGGSVPQTRYYQLAPVARPDAATADGELVLAIETLQTDQPYDDERIVYRTNPYRLDYYDYHRWGTTPGELITRYLEQALERSGSFRSVVRGDASGATGLVLTGRVIALEEVDVSKEKWLGRVAIELTATDATTGKVVWTEQFEETEPMVPRSPQGLAKAISVAMGRIAGKLAPALVTAARENGKRPTRVVRETGS